MGNASIVIAGHVVILTAFFLVAGVWFGWFRRNWLTLLNSPMGLLVCGFAVLATWLAWEAVYYGSARIMQDYADIDLWSDGAAPYWIGVSRVVVIGGGVSLALIARWRLDNLPADAIKTRMMTLFCGAVVLFSAVTAVLW